MEPQKSTSYPTTESLPTTFTATSIQNNNLRQHFPYEIVTIDFETYYDKEYSLSKITMEEYIRSDKFEAIMVGVQLPTGEQRIITGTHQEIKYALEGLELERYAVLADNTLFDGAILSWVFGIKPLFWLDTLSMGRAMFGVKGNSLEALAERYNLQKKGTYVLNALGKRREDFNEEEFARYSEYCLLDVTLCRQLFHLMNEGWYELESFDRRHPFPSNEYRLIDAHIRMFTEPKLILNKTYLETHLAEVQQRKETLLKSAGFDK